jgi:tRNA(fMet)-specific endonuclease VapC
MGDMGVSPVLDSDVLIDFLRGRGAGNELMRELAPSLGFRVTAVTAFELALGQGYARDPRSVDALLSAPCLMLTREAALSAGRLLRKLRSDGTGIDIRDAMQAGICIEADVPLITRNARHFERVPHLQITHPADWVS